MNDLARKKLLEARDAKGITQTEMAERLGKRLNQSYSLRQYQKLEAGEFPKYKKEVVEEIDLILGTHLYELIYEQKEGDVALLSGDLNKVIGSIEDRILRAECALEVYELTLAGLLCDPIKPQKGEFMKKVGELRQEVEKVVNRRFDEVRKSQ